MDSTNTPSEYSSYLPNPRLPYNARGGHIPPAKIRSNFIRHKLRHPFLNAYIGKKNPYTDFIIQSEADYDEYLREYCYYEHCNNVVMAAEQALDEQRRNPPPDQYKALYNEATNKLKESEQELKRRRRRARIVFVVLLSVFVLLCILFSAQSYHSGYAAGEKAGYAAGEKAGYESGKEDGYASGKKAGYSSGYADAKAKYKKTTTASPGTPRDTAIADGYIGNKKTKKYHLSTCSYLPDKENQVVFSSASAAEASGYDPCGRCKP